VRMICLHESHIEELLSKRTMIRTLEPSVFDYPLTGSIVRYLLSGETVAVRNHQSEPGSVLLVRLDRPASCHDFLSGGESNLEIVALLFWGRDALTNLIEQRMVSTNDVHLYALKDERDYLSRELTLDEMYGVATEVEVTILP